MKDELNIIDIVIGIFVWLCLLVFVGAILCLPIMSINYILETNPLWKPIWTAIFYVIIGIFVSNVYDFLCEIIHDLRTKDEPDDDWDF